MTRPLHLFLGVYVAAQFAASQGVVLAQLADPIPAPITTGNITINLEPVADGLTAPIQLTDAGDGSDRHFIVDQTGTIHILGASGLMNTPFLDVSNRLVSLGANYDERGLLGLAFHPEFANPSSPGYGKIYTYTSEPVSGQADFTVPLGSGQSFNHQSAIAEWQVSATDPNLVDTTTRREIMRIDQPQSNHNGGMLAFGNDGMLHISLGDGGAADDQGAGHSAIGNGQDRSNVLGTILRIDPLGQSGQASANGQYSVPDNNPFVGGGDVGEIYAYGFRNPFRFSFDRPTGRLIVADVGQNDIEEVDIATAGGNFGWRVKEGTFLFDPNGTGAGFVTADSPGSPADLIDPVLQYDHDEGLAIIGGFVYHGSLISELEGKYVFGDFRDPAGPGGRLFYGDLDSGAINEFLFEDGQGLLLPLKAFGQDGAGELYVLAGPTGTTGTGGMVFRVVPEPSSLAMLAIALIGLIALRRRLAR